MLHLPCNQKLYQHTNILTLYLYSYEIYFSDSQAMSAFSQWDSVGGAEQGPHHYLGVLVHDVIRVRVDPEQAPALRRVGKDQ